MNWTIVSEPQGRDINNPSNDKNNGGLVFYLIHAATSDPYRTAIKQEVNRVAFDRTQSANPEKSFSEMVDEVIAVCIKSRDLLNGELWGDGTLQ